MYVGLAFWKCPCRKVYTVTRRNIQDGACTPLSSSLRKRPIVLDSDDESMAPPRPKTEEKLDGLMHEVENIKYSMKDIVSLSKNTPIPVALRRILRDTFKCSICHSVLIRPPVIVTKCCKTILGCEVCVNSWFSGPDALTKCYPSCCADRGYNDTMLLQ